MSETAPMTVEEQKAFRAEEQQRWAGREAQVNAALSPYFDLMGEMMSDAQAFTVRCACRKAFKEADYFVKRTDLKVDVTVERIVKGRKGMPWGMWAACINIDTTHPLFGARVHVVIGPRGAVKSGTLYPAMGKMQDLATKNIRWA